PITIHISMTNISAINNNQVLKKLQEFFFKFPKFDYHKDEILLRAHDTPSGVYYVAKGKVRMYSLSTEGEELTIHIFREGTFFPLTWAINQTPNGYFFEALTDVEIFRAPREAVENLLKKESDVLLDLTSRLLSGIGGIATRMQHIVYDQALPKTAGILLYLGKIIGKPDNSKVVILHSFTHEDIAVWAGLTRVAVSNSMGALKKMGLISCGNGKIVLNDPKKMESLSNVAHAEQ
ncbi:MAG: Crp/Fnr family transcriptional regulator, partial [bacterium]